MEIKRLLNHFIRSVLLAGLVISLTSCGHIISNAKQEFAEDLSSAIQEFDDPETIKKGAPAYLIMVSSLINGDPENPQLLESGAKLYGAYASGFADSVQSKQALANRSFEYASRAICIRDENFCDVKHISYFEFEKRLESVEKDQAEYLFVFISSWAGVIEANSSDWNAIAELPKVKAGIQCVIDRNETVSDGNAHLYMAVMESILPPALGGKSELAKKHFDRAIELSDDKNLMAKVLYAEKYARMLFERDLHDKLLNQVLDADIESSNHVLLDVLAKQRATELLNSADDYF